ncbi:MAG: hypothetical protein ICV73_18445 [Acetobacteraceae bacterium]|nr:hypothetical protein [Acetobacteraceae bacterium]
MQDTRPHTGLWLFWPDYSGENPFQHMVRRAFPPGWDIRSGGLDSASAALGEGRAGPVVFHLHWDASVVFLCIIKGLTRVTRAGS